MPLVAAWLQTQLPASLKLHGETLALATGRDASHGRGDDLILDPSVLEALQAAAAAGSSLAEVSGAISRRHYQNDRPLHLQLSFFATDATAASQLMAVALTDLDPPAKSMMFAGLEHTYLPEAQAQFGGGNLGQGGVAENDGSASHWVSPCVLQWRPPAGHAAAAGCAPLAEHAPPAGCTLGPLTDEDAAIVNDTWAYGGSEETRVNRVLPCIQQQLSVGLRVEETGELVSWAIGDHPYGAVGKVYTLYAHRRKGYVSTQAIHTTV